MTEYKVGLVGLGEISSYFVNGVNLNPNTELVAICQRKPIEKKEDKERYKSIKFYSDWKSLVDDTVVNCIIVATPPSTHANITDYALKKKKKVIVEKPYSLSLEEAYHSVKIAKENKVHLYFAYHAAFNPMTLRTKEIIQQILSSGDKISSFKVIFREDVRNYHGANSWIFNPLIAGGGCLIDSGVNAISVVENVGVGHVRPLKVSLGYNPDFKVEISAHVEFVSTLDPHVTGELIQDWLHQGEEKREITVKFKSGLSVAFDNATGILTKTYPNGKVEKQNIAIRESSDQHNTPMVQEYINIVNNAIEFFQQRKEFIDTLGVGPFETVMQCYELERRKSKL